MSLYLQWWPLNIHLTTKWRQICSTSPTCEQKQLIFPGRCVQYTYAIEGNSRSVIPRLLHTSLTAKRNNYATNICAIILPTLGVIMSYPSVLQHLAAKMFYAMQIYSMWIVKLSVFVFCIGFAFISVFILACIIGSNTASWCSLHNFAVLCLQ